MKNKIIITLSIIGGVLFIPIIIAKIASWYWRWNGFLLNFAFNTSGWESNDLIITKVVLFVMGLLISLVIIEYFSNDKKTK